MKVEVDNHTHFMDLNPVAEGNAKMLRTMSSFDYAASASRRHMRSAGNFHCKNLNRSMQRSEINPMLKTLDRFENRRSISMGVSRQKFFKNTLNGNATPI